MSQFNPSELASYAKQEVQVQDEYRKSDSNAKKLPSDTLITHHGEIIGELSALPADTRCDCPEGHLHSDGCGEDYAHSVLLSGGDIGISCSGDSCGGLFIPDLQKNRVNIQENSSEELDVRRLDDDVLLHFTPEMIPEPIRHWTLDNCKQAEGSLNYGAVSGIIACSNLIGYRCAVKPKQNSNWKIIPNLWGMLIGNPSTRKSPIMEQFIKPIKRLESEAAELFKQKMNVYESEKVSIDIANKVKKKAIEDAYKSGIESEIDKANSTPVPLIEEPKRERFVMNDSTTEAAGNIMSDNPRTLLLIRDELSGFFASFNKAGREGDRSFYLEAHKGDSSYTYDRIGRGTIHIDKLSIGIFGTIQPSILAKYILPANGDSGDGLAQRMQLAVFSDNELRPYYDEHIDKDAVESAYQIFKELAYADYEVMAGVHNDIDGIPYFHFSDKAQELFVDWYNKMKISERLERNTNIQAHIGKYYGLLPSLALTFFLIDKVSDRTNALAIEISHLELAIEWCTVLESHARMMYKNSEEKQEVNLEDKIVDYVKEHQTMLPASFGVISRCVRRANAADVKRALDGIAEVDGKTVIKLLYT